MMKSNISVQLPLLPELLEDALSLWPTVAQTCSKRKKNEELVVIFNESTGICAFLLPLVKNRYRLFVPIGSFDRLFLLSYLFMSATKVNPCSVIYSVRDKRLKEPFIPERLSAIFKPSDETFSKFSEELISDYCEPHFVPTFLRDAVLVGTFFLANHELGHFNNHHREIQEILENNKQYSYTEETLGMSKKEIMEGFEAHADQEAARNTAALISMSAHSVKASGGDFYSTLLNSALGLAFIVTLFDHKSRSLATDGDSFYPHPLVRWTLIHGAIAENLEESLKEAFSEAAVSAGYAVTQFINGLLFSEISREKSSSEYFPKNDLVPLAQLNADESLFGESVLFEHVIQSVERGRRIVFLAQLMGLDVGLDEQWKVSPTNRFENFMKRVDSVKNRNV